jgi:uncharacterized protein (DUF2267 family)
LIGIKAGRGELCSGPSNNCGKTPMRTGFAVFDATIQETNLWLGAVQAALPSCDQRQAYAALQAVLHVLRDRLPLPGVLDLSAQLPLLLRGITLEGWRPHEGLSAVRDLQGFAEAVARRLPHDFPEPAREVAEAVLAVIAAKLAPAEASRIGRLLPEPLRTAWPHAVAA